MNISRLFCLCLVVGNGLGMTVQAQHTERGAVLGGVTGALAGAAIGKHNGETAGGALIGAAAGLLGGALIGNSLDAESSRRQYVEQQVIAQHSRAVSTTDVLSMTQSGVSDAVIVNHIREHGVQHRLEVSDVIFLHRNGVSEPVLSALQHAPVGAPVRVVPVRTYAPPVVVREHHYIGPAYPVYAPRYYHHPGYSRGPSVHYGFSFSR